MRPWIKLLCLAISAISIGCGEHELSPSSGEPGSGGKTSSTTSCTGLTQFKTANLAIPSGGLKDGQRFYTDGSLRANIAYYPYSVKRDLKDGQSRIRFYVKPTDPASFLVGTEHPYHYRAEFTRYPWKIGHPLGTEEWIGFSYIFPTVAEGFTQNRTPVSIYQNHAGRVLGADVNPPAIQIEIAYPGQLKSYTDPNRNTPLGGELMIINKPRGIRWVVPGVRVVPGARINFIIQIVYGLGDEGLLNIWINGKLVTCPGNATVPAGNVGSTVFPPLTALDIPVGGNSKFGIYHHQLRYPEYVTLNYRYGHTHMKMWMTDWNDVIRTPASPDYKSDNAYSAVDTSTYP